MGDVLMVVYYHGGRHKNIESAAAELGLTYIPIRGNYFTLATKEYRRAGKTFIIPKTEDLHRKVAEKKLPLLGAERFERLLATNYYFRNVIDRMEHLTYNLSELTYQNNDDEIVTLPRGEEYIRFSDAVRAFQPYNVVLSARFSACFGKITFDKDGSVLVPDYIYEYGRDEIDAAIKSGLR